MTRAAGAMRRVLLVLLAAVLLSGGLVVALQLARPAGGRPTDLPPPPGGYFTLQPVGSYASLPTGAEAAAGIFRSTWEPRPSNSRYNNTIPVKLNLQHIRLAAHAYDPRWDHYILDRITGDFRGTTDEIIQWAAAKWGLPDNILRVIAYMESDWFQSNSGDLVYNRAQCLPGYTNPPCPVTFGIVGVKSTNWPGIFPGNRESTAVGVDVLGGWLRGCFEGWVWWLRDHGNRSRGVYRAGDLWGCVGAWYSGNWHDGPADGTGGQNYLDRAKYWLRERPWLRRGFARITRS